MTPDDLAAVDRTWADLRCRRPLLVDLLTVSFADRAQPDSAPARAHWLFGAVADLVGLLPEPSALGDRARELATTWPVAGTAPSYCVEGEAWMDASRTACPTWTDRTERAWRQAWLLLSDVLAAESLSPFAGPCSGVGSAP